jgi:putative sugar O-methyltransferase
MHTNQGIATDDRPGTETYETLQTILSLTNDGHLGGVWQRPAEIYRQICRTRPDPATAIKDILALGIFSQFTAFSCRQLIENICRWYGAYLNDHGLPLASLPQSIRESSVVRPETLVELADRTVSPDFLRFLSYVHLLHAHGALSAHRRRTIEIGPGYGGLARTLKLFQPGLTCVLVDIPESLACAFLFLRTDNPAAKIRVIESADALMGDIDQYDYVLVPAQLIKILDGYSFDLFINTWSFGEMPNAYLEGYFRLLQEALSVQYVFLLNRMITYCHVNESQRLTEGNWITKLDHHWEILDFDFDPAFHRCPYTTVAPRLLSIVARRLPNPLLASTREKQARELVQAVAGEDWVISSLQGVQDPYFYQPAAKTLFNTDAFPVDDSTSFELDLYAAGVDNRLLGVHQIDGGMNGTLYRLWNSIRLCPTPLAVRLMRVYLRILRAFAPPGHLFREEYFYACLLPDALAGDDRLIVPEWLSQGLRAIVASGTPREATQQPLVASDFLLAKDGPPVPPNDPTPARRNPLYKLFQRWSASRKT